MDEADAAADLDGLHEEFQRKRAAATEAIVRSDASKKLVVAGPGTGKTFTFRMALDVCEERGLALTFIRNLVDDLRDALSDIADVFTFHAFCKYQLHRNPIADLRDGWRYYPLLLELIAHDLALLDRVEKSETIERALHTLDHDNPVLAEALRLGTYYNAVSHCDVVYRMLMHFAAHDDLIPQYPLVVVDEYQDFSLMETMFIELFASVNKVLVAGDDDQALYAFRHAEARFIRKLAEGGQFERFPLPYCSRCTDVVVSAVNDVIRAALANGNLAGRLDKDFQCFVPDKAEDSAAHPQIIHARCSVERKAAPYGGRYIVQQIAAIPVEDIRESRERDYPTVLVVGPNPFLSAAYDVIRERFPQAQLRKADKLQFDPLDGYRYLADDERARLGWRVLIADDPFAGSNDVLREVARDEAELVELIPDEYRDRHLAIARLVGRLMNGEALNDNDEVALVEALGRSFDDILGELAVKASREQDEGAEPMAIEDIAPTPELASTEAPSVVCTTLIGSKGLSAGYVFIVGFSNGHLPHDPQDITDHEICEFLVGLSRTRKECHVISVNHYGAGTLDASVFARWIKPHVRKIAVDKAYFDRHGG
jgi:superfamily I DNA/RNA helicase